MSKDLEKWLKPWKKAKAKAEQARPMLPAKSNAHGCVNCKRCQRLPEVIHVPEARDASKPAHWAVFCRPCATAPATDKERINAVDLWNKWNFKP